MKKDSISDFINAWKKYDRPSLHRPGPFGIHTERPELNHWQRRFKDAGYYEVQAPMPIDVDEGHTYRVHPSVKNWCDEKFGSDHYSWIYDRFYFETEKDAMLFVLRWL